jgi:adenylate cyclase
MAEEGAAKRKLAALLSADVVGYSRLMADDDRATLDTLKRYRAVFQRLIEKHDGRVVNAPGDALLAAFASALEALHAALEIQKGLAARNDELPEPRRMHFRIGLSVGDVLIEPDGTIYGDGVNIAARMEALAGPGGVCLSGTVYDHVKGKLAAGFDDLGPQQVKNFADPVRAYRVVPAEPGAVAEEKPEATAPRWRARAIAAVAILVVAAVVVVWGVAQRADETEPEEAVAGPETEVAAVERMAHPLPKEPSIVVLPLDNLSADPELDRLADGLTENITAALSQVRDLFVIARNSAFTYKGKAVKVQQVAEELGVRYVLEGSLQASSERIRVTAQLIDALSGDHVWSGRYDRALTDIFEVQDDITLNLVTALQIELTEGPQAASWLQAGSHNLDAWRNFWRGRELYWTLAKEDNARARQLFEKALELDPDFPLAWAWLGLTHYLDAARGYSTSAEDSLRQAEDIARKVLTFDNSGPYGYMLLGFVLLRKRQYDEAIGMLEKAVALSPSTADVTASLSEALLMAGRPIEALARIKEAMRLNPYYPPYYLDVSADALRLTEQYEESAAAAEQALERSPDTEVEQLIYLIYDYAKLGREAEARAAVEELLRREPEFSVEIWKPKFWQRQPYRDPAVIDELFDVLHQAGVPERPSSVERERPSIAVLPFDNLSEDTSQDYFVDGLTEEIIGTLARFPDLAVIARNSTFRYKGQAVDVRAVGEELGVKYLVEGSVRRAADTIRVTAQLIETETGSHLWSETYDHALTAENVFAIQDDIAAAIATTLADTYGVLRQEGLAAARRKPPSQLSSYECVLLAMEHLRTLSAETNKAARSCLERAVESDPDYAAAWFNLARIYIDAERMDYDPPPDALDRALDAAQRAVQLAPGDADAHWRLAHAHFFRGELDAFKSEAERAIGYADKGSSVRGTAGLFLAYAGDWDRGLALLDEWAAYDPHLPGWYHSGAFFDHYRKGEYEQALAAAQRMGLPDYVWTNAGVAAAYGQLGQRADAQPYVEKILALDPDFEATARANRWKWFRYQEDLLDHFMDGLRKAGLNVEVTGG